MIVFAVGDGHGKETPGKRTPDGYRENFFNNAAKIHTIREMKRHGVTMLDASPESDDTPLSTRVARVNAGIKGVKPKGYCSIHFNAYGDGEKYNEVEGIETHCHPQAPSNGCKLLAKYLQEALIKGTKQKNRGVKYSDFYVLRKTYCPAALVECGFMTNKRESELMQDAKFQLECGIEIAKGCLKYIGINWQPESQRKKYDEILKEVSKYYKVWLQHIKENPQVNLKGLIEELYYICGK
ncbi:MAG: N-acetylmuramoyl-L-alanine amidase [Calditrichaeota bacterium]|nr:MAG: N-acetylmuramoyl-L-alanine amidase [Calditrichota bacterium]